MMSDYNQFREQQREHLHSIDTNESHYVVCPNCGLRQHKFEAGRPGMEEAIMIIQTLNLKEGVKASPKYECISCEYRWELEDNNPLDLHSLRKTARKQK